MIEMKREGGEWQVVVDGAVVFSGMMLEARAEYSKRQAARLNAKGSSRTGGKRIYR